MPFVTLAVRTVCQQTTACCAALAAEVGADSLGFVAPSTGVVLLELTKARKAT